MGSKINVKSYLTVFLLAVTCLNSYAGDPDIVDPSYLASAPLLSKRLSAQEFLGVVKITAMQEIRGGCGFSYEGKIVKKFKGQATETIRFTSFQPTSFQGGGYYLIFFSKGYTSGQRILKEKEPEISIEGMGEHINLERCKGDFDHLYADDENSFHIAPSLSSYFKSRWVIVNSYTNHVDPMLKNDTKSSSPCQEDQASFRQCIDLKQMVDFICKNVDGVVAVDCKAINK